MSHYILQTTLSSLYQELNASVCLVIYQLWLIHGCEEFWAQSLRVFSSQEQTHFMTSMSDGHTIHLFKYVIQRSWFQGQLNDSDLMTLVLALCHFCVPSLVITRWIPLVPGRGLLPRSQQQVLPYLRLARNTSYSDHQTSDIYVRNQEHSMHSPTGTTGC